MQSTAWKADWTQLPIQGIACSIQWPGSEISLGSEEGICGWIIYDQMVLRLPYNGEILNFHNLFKYEYPK